MPILRMSDLVVPGFSPIWYCNISDSIRYRVVVGARGTGKSVNIGGYEAISKILSSKVRNIAYVRKNDSDNSTSTYQNLQWCISKMGIGKYFWFRSQPNRIIYIPTGQVMYFKGFNNPTGLTSTAVATGYLTDIYVEEAFEISSEDEFRMLDGSLRAPDGIPCQITFLLNPWDIDCWIYKKFCEGRMPDDVEYMESHDYQLFIDESFQGDYGRGLAIHRSAYTINKFLPSVWKENALAMRERSSSIYNTEYLGLWGNASEGTYPDFKQEYVMPICKLQSMQYAEYAIGIDTGFSNGEGKIRKDGRIKSATTAILIAITSDYRKIVALGEYYWTNDGKKGDQVKKPNSVVEEILKRIIDWDNIFYQTAGVMKGRVNVFVDNADAIFPDLMRVVSSMPIYQQKGVIRDIRVNPSTKKMTIRNRVDFENFLFALGDLLICSDCKNLIREMRASKKGKNKEPRDDLNDHAINAFEYGWAPFRHRIVANKDFKER